ncbi:MAG: type II toxin-antitoxin system HicB family antitoxin [Acidobacteria bacterium]|nr:type II toxin-antitoxin system HicB family antitoxin [Acidobacteriota bacterium]
MLVEYVQKKMETAKYKKLEDGTYFGEIPGLRGVWGNAKKLEDCRRELQEVLEGWLLLKVSDREPIPGFKWKVEKVKLVNRA